MENNINTNLVNNSINDDFSKFSQSIGMKFFDFLNIGEGLHFIISFIIPVFNIFAWIFGLIFYGLKGKEIIYKSGGKNLSNKNYGMIWIYNLFINDFRYIILFNNLSRINLNFYINF